MRILAKALMSLLLVVGLAASAQALTITIHGESTANVTMNWTINNGVIDIYETWNSAGYLFLVFDDLPLGPAYVVNKHLTNNTGVDWNSFSNELLDPAGDANDADHDVLPYPSWLPTRYTTSNDYDQLHFDQGGGTPRTSVAFDSLLVDETTDVRDFLDFYNGIVSGGGGTDLMSFGLENDYASNDPFILAQRPNEFAIIPEPATLALLATGLLGLGCVRRRGR